MKEDNHLLQATDLSHQTNTFVEIKWGKKW